MPSSSRSAFLISFSPDCTKVASTHGDHNVYVSDVKTGNVLHILEGHPRTPWCIAFHPTSNDILATGCLGGEVRLWKLNGDNEVWRAENGQVIASLTFHPFLQLLVIATGNALHFWDCKESQPNAYCTTGSDQEKVRFVKFDSFGNRLITGISNCHAPTKVKSKSYASRIRHRRVRRMKSTISIRRRGLNINIGEEDTAGSTSNEAYASSSSSDSNDDSLWVTAGSGNFGVTCVRLRYLHMMLESRLKFHQHLHRSTESDDGFQFPSDNTLSDPSDFEEFSLFMSGSDGVQLDLANRSRYAGFMSTLTRIRKLLRLPNMSVGPVPSVSSEVQRKIHTIRERQRIISGFYRQLSTLLHDILEALARIEQSENAGTDRQRFDLEFCLWLIEMAFDLTDKLSSVIEEDSDRYSVVAAHMPEEESIDENTIRLRFGDLLAEYNSNDIVSNARISLLGDNRGRLQHILSQQFASLSARRYEDLGRRMRIVDLISENIRDEELTRSPEHSLSRLFSRVRNRLVQTSNSGSHNSDPSQFSSMSDDQMYASLFETISEDSSNESEATSSPFRGLSLNPISRATGPNAPYPAWVDQTHRIQSWDFSQCNLPEIYCASANVVVKRCLIHNDASVDISQDGEKLISLIPPENTSSKPFIFGVFSLRPNTLGKILCTWSFVSNAISVSFSPLAQYILVGLASTQPMLSTPEAVAHIVKLDSLKTKIFKGATNKVEKEYSIKHIRSLTHLMNNQLESRQVSLNSIRWLPQSGQGIAYATNKGCLSICRPKAPMFIKKSVGHPSKSMMQSSGISLGIRPEVASTERSLFFEQYLALTVPISGSDPETEAET